MSRPPIPGAAYAFQIVHAQSPVLRMRYRRGVAVDPYGFPDWLPYARTVVQLPPSSPELGVDEARVVDVLTANRVLGRAGDPLCDGLLTPAGWTWAHARTGRRLALVPVELHGMFRHAGGVSTGAADRNRRGLPPGGEPAATVIGRERVAPEALAVVADAWAPLPADYAELLAETNGFAVPEPYIHPRFGFVVDQPFFGLAHADRAQDLLYANLWFADRLTPEFAAIGYVQGGLVVLKLRGTDSGSVWYLDDDDPAGTDDDSPAHICRHLLRRCADGIRGFLAALVTVPPALQELANAAAGHAALVDEPGLGRDLSAKMRPAPPAADRAGPAEEPA